MLRTTITILPLLISCCVFGQRGLKISANDFNKDGVIDTLKSYYEGGSGFGGKYVQIINGKTNEVYELTDEGCFCEIKHVVPIPPELNKTENEHFLEAIKKELLPEKRNHPDPSLEWMIRGSFSSIKLDDNSLFNHIINPQIAWSRSKFEPFSNYYIEIDADTLNQLYTPSYGTPEWYNEDTKGFLVYYAHNHYRSESGDSVKLSDKNSLYKIFNTSHGVFVEKGDLYKWLFISDVSLTGAPSKLRWESIKKVMLIDNYVIIQQSLPPSMTSQFFVINIESGICGQLKYDASDANHFKDKTDIVIIEDRLMMINGEEGTFSHPLADVFEELEKY